MFLSLFTDLAWGEARARAADGGVSDDPASDFTRVLAGDERSDEGEGDTGRPTPTPQAAITIVTSITRVPTA
jgi:hypothetical protein